MIFKLYSLQQDYEQLLEVTKKEKQSVKKSIPKLEKLKSQNAELGLDTVPLDEKVVEQTKKLEDFNSEIVKYKKVIHRLGVCISILQGEEVDESQTEPLETDETQTETL